jgi:hypothetical protein
MNLNVLSPYKMKASTFSSQEKHTLIKHQHSNSRSRGEGGEAELASEWPSSNCIVDEARS